MQKNVLATRIATVLVISFGVYVWIHSTFNPAPKLSDKDYECRQLIRDIQGAKTLAEDDFAKQRFATRCGDWRMPSAQ
jgi:hypothetical protein